jgi:hypothetical protein
MVCCKHHFEAYSALPNGGFGREYSSGLANVDVCHGNASTAEPICDNQIHTIEPKLRQKSAPDNKFVYIC